MQNLAQELNVFKNRRDEQVKDWRDEQVKDWREKSLRFKDFSSLKRLIENNPED